MSLLLLGLVPITQKCRLINYVKNLLSVDKLLSLRLRKPLFLEACVGGAAILEVFAVELDVLVVVLSLA